LAIQFSERFCELVQPAKGMLDYHQHTQGNSDRLTEILSLFIARTSEAEASPV
jgi:hypothetical protein